MNYLITGATGNIGSRVVERLLDRGERPRVFVRNAEKARSRYGDRVDIFVGDFADAAAMTAALTGVDAFLLVSSIDDLVARDEVAAKAAKAAKVKHLVKISSLAIPQKDVGTGVWHAQGEAAVRASGVPFTFIRPSGFMENCLWWARSIKSEGVVRSSAGDGKSPVIHSDDIAAVATKALITQAYIGESLPVTGPELLSYPEMVAKIGAQLGKPLRFEALSDEEERRQLITRNRPPHMVEALLSIFRAMREGRLAKVTDTVERVLGQKPISFDRWVEQNAATFR
ncbi:MAG TPA: NAD(P)H-binding protein [Candidatus Sulfotelmatobacter sp.]